MIVSFVDHSLILPITGSCNDILATNIYLWGPFSPYSCTWPTKQCMLGMPTTPFRPRSLTSTGFPTSVTRNAGLSLVSYKKRRTFTGEL